MPLIYPKPRHRQRYVRDTLLCVPNVSSPGDTEKTSTSSFCLRIRGSVAIAAGLLVLARYGILQQIQSHFLFCSSAVFIFWSRSPYTLFFPLSCISSCLIQYLTSSLSLGVDIQHWISRCDPFMMFRSPHSVRWRTDDWQRTAALRKRKDANGANHRYRKTLCGISCFC